MKYFNIKRYKFSTVIRSLNNLEKDILNFLKLINFKKIYSYFYSLKRVFGKIIKYFYPSKINIIEVSNKIKIKSNKFLFYHLPISVIFFGFLYLAIPTFYTYDKSKIENIICEKYNVKCVIKGKIKYNFFPSPRLKINDLIINIPSNNITLLTVDKAFLKLSIKNLLAKDKHKYKKIV